MLRSIQKKYPSFHIAVTHLRGKKRQTMVAMLGVTFGIAVFIFQAGLITGFQTIFIEKTINNTANIHMYVEADKNRLSILEQQHPDAHTWYAIEGQKPREKNLKIKNVSNIIADLDKRPEVQGVSPFLGGQAIFRSGTTQKAGRFAGIDVRKEDLLFNMKQYMKYGDLLHLETSPNGIILGSGLAEDLGVKLNDVLSVISQNGVSIDLKVIGIHESGLVEVDRSRGFVRIVTAQKLLNVEGNYITDLNIKLKDIDKAETLAVEFAKKYNITAQDWKQANASIFSVFKVQNMVTYLVIFSIMIVSGFGIFNIQMMIIYEKLGDIAILKAIGYRDKDILRIFQIESLTIGFLGGLLGLLLGYLITTIVGHIPLNVKGFVAIKYLTFNREPIFFIMAFTFGLIATAVAGYLPARKAARIDPVDIIRGK